MEITFRIVEKLFEDGHSEYFPEMRHDDSSSSTGYGWFDIREQKMMTGNNGYGSFGDARQRITDVRGNTVPSSTRVMQIKIHDEI